MSKDSGKEPARSTFSIGPEEQRVPDDMLYTTVC